MREFLTENIEHRAALWFQYAIYSRKKVTVNEISLSRPRVRIFQL